ncbi:MAG: FAD-binding oxidoreductase [Roseiflexaceae bacterium]|nr:FAD-binding oxidoreductase [Roseiflexaceae bacterium]
MRHITIIGAGQAGLQLGLGLLSHGYSVRLVSDRDPEAIRNGSILSTQCMFGSSREIERAAGMNLWDSACPPVVGMHLRVAGPDGTAALAWSAPLERPGQSVDQRVKMPACMELFVSRGGELLVEKADIASLERYARQSELVVVAAGKGEVGALFPRDEAHSPFQKPQRTLAASCVHGYAAAQPFDGVTANMIPGVGEYFVMPGLTCSGPCHFMIMEAVPGGPLDCWGDVRDATEHVALLQRLLTQWLPWEGERARHMQPADAQATIRGRYTPVVRHPVAWLPSGTPMLGLADTVVLNDPITGQGANNAAKAAACYLEYILARGGQPFDAVWMQATFDAAWSDAQWATGWTNAMLQPPPPHVLEILGAAAELPAVARWFANGFDRPASLFPWIAEPIAAEHMLASHAVTV